jgi:hypothetical protein
MMDVAIVAASGIREFFHVRAFEFESDSVDRRAVSKDGQKKFLDNLKECINKNPVVAQRLGRLRYKLRTSRVQAV